jgi:hydroxymethylpyrimidine pyrophosphatase-like HAD family hydrolase
MLHFDFHICTSGAHILDGNGITLSEQKLGRSTAAALWDMGKALPFMVVQANGRLYSPNPSSPFQIYVNAFDEIPGDCFFGVSFYAQSAEEAAEMAAAVNREWSGTATAFHNSFCMDVVAHGVSKGNALLAVKQRMDMDCMAAIGDSFNDLPMLRDADVSFTFPDSPEELRRTATHIVPTVGAALHMLEGGFERQ